MTKKQNLILRILQLIPAVILFYASYSKLSSQAGDVFIFTALHMEPVGRYLAGIIELVSALCLLTYQAAPIGAVLALWTMVGAAIAHATVLGASIQGDGGIHIVFLIVVSSISALVIFLRRKELPFIGHTF